jgi:hypothetical protein
MDQHFPDEMTYWSERPTLPVKYKPPRKKILRKEIRYRIVAQPDMRNGGKLRNRLCKIVVVFLFNIRLFSYKTKI